MSTHSNVVVYNNRDEIMLVLYNQWDGDVFENDLIPFLDKIKIVNGIPVGAKLGEIANGAGCFCAQLVSYLKTDVGNIYITNDSFPTEDYVYKIKVDLGIIDLDKYCEGELEDSWRFET